MSVDFERIILEQNGSGEIVSANNDQHNLSMNLLNFMNDENSIRRNSEYDAKIETNDDADDAYAVIGNKMSIKHLLQNDDAKDVNYTDYFSEIPTNDNEYSVKKENSDNAEILPDLLNDKENYASTSFGNCIDDAVNIQQNDTFKSMEGENTHIVTSSDANAIEASLGNNVFNGNLLSHMTLIHEITNEPTNNLSDNSIIEGASIHYEQVTREPVFESSDHLINFGNKNMINEDSNDLQTNPLLLLADLAIADIDSSRVLTIEEVPNMSLSDINAQEVATVPITGNQIGIKDMICQVNQDDSDGLSSLQFLPELLKKDFEREQETIHCQDNLVVLNTGIPEIQSEFKQIHYNNEMDVSSNIVMNINKKTVNDNENNKSDENFQGHQCSKFGNDIFRESYANLFMKKQSDFIEQTLPSSLSDSDHNKNSISDNGKFSSDLQSFEHIVIKDDEMFLADDNVLSLSPSCEQVKNKAEKEYSSNDDEQSTNRTSTGEQSMKDTEKSSTYKEEPQSNESITEPIKCEILFPTSPKGEQQLASSPSIIVTRSMIASLNLKDSTSLMSLDEKKQLLLEVRKKKSMLRNSIIQNKQLQNVEDNESSLTMDSAKLLLPQKKISNKLNNTALNRLTKQNTDKNKEYRCDLNVVVVRKNIPKPPSPASKLHEKKRNGGGIVSALRSRNNKGMDNMGSCIPVLKSRGGRQNLVNQDESPNKGVHWCESRLTQESSPFIKSSPRTARQRPIPKPCLKQTNTPIDSLGNVINANSSLTPMVKRGIKVTVKQVKYKGEE
ncbi:hypothetical protein RclHR1_00760007 [Rhizophagus clarus]|uniref:Uncharacterized protein n=1 Tax=Rhizophagus clarus TaxID=94130 RepID=A0A2Z6SLB5_9GLOM|nr:hypothetical protein RclHR1_00760007 [Rhizophagus clarus]GES86624.1 hypothetical protein GLOIN_2v1783187 [Rhizophagus clarus]